jgi:hypothetical protein
VSVIEQSRIEANRRAVSADLDAPRASPMERLLRFVRVPRHVARLVVATPSLRRAWYLSIGVAVLVGLGSATPDDRASLFPLLVLAPLVPVLGVALAYGPAADPSHEVQLATPIKGLRLVTIRAMTVLIMSMALIVLLTVLNANARPMAAAWLLPGIAVTWASLGAMTSAPPRRATAAVGAGWLVAVLVVRVAADDPLAAFGAVGQFIAIAVALVGMAVSVVRRASFDRLESLV